MSILAPDERPHNLNPASPTNPRDSCPLWTDRRWTLAPERINPLDSADFLAEVARRPERCLTQDEFRALVSSQTLVTGPPMAWLPFSATIAVLTNLTPWRFVSPRPAEPNECLPTYDDVYHPTAEDLAEYEAWLAELDARDDAMAEWAAADHTDRMEAAFGDPWDLVHPDEIARSGGSHPSQAYDLP